MRGGFRHLLYAVGPACENACRATTVWHVDAEPSGMVIWSEMVWPFGWRAGAVEASSDPEDLPTSLLPDDLARQAPGLVAAVRSDAGPEGFWAVTLGADPRALAFFAITHNGDVRPGTWSYGRRLADAHTHEAGHAELRLQLTPEQGRLRQSYLSTLP